MSIPFDQELAKRRLLYQRAQREFEQRRADYERIKREAFALVSEAEKARNDAYWAYEHRARELGYCGNCQNPLSECRCAPGMAATG